MLPYRAAYALGPGFKADGGAAAAEAAAAAAASSSSVERRSSGGASAALGALARREAATAAASTSAASSSSLSSSSQNAAAILLAAVRPGPDGIPVATALAIGAGVHAWRADHAPPPSGVLWDNVVWKHAPHTFTPLP